MNTLSEDAIRRLPPVIDIPTAARAFGLGKNFAYELALRGEFPCPVHRIGRFYRVKTSELRAALGLVEHTDTAR
jgi:predicted DNA-binding transcriptional regulator AlpA